MAGILITGALGQVGSELTPLLQQRYGADTVLATDIRAGVSGPNYARLDITDAQALAALLEQHHIHTIYHLAAILSAVAEADPPRAWKVNMDGLFNVLEAARAVGARVFIPSSIAAFGPGTPLSNTPQDTLQRPNTLYGVTKVAGELLCDYYWTRFGLDVRGLRYPGLISYVAPPGGGTTDYAVDIFYQALQEGEYTCFLAPDTRLPMMYMPDALRATAELMDAPLQNLKHRNAFNIAAMSFTPGELATEIQKHLPRFKMRYTVQPVRQAIADSWPHSIDDSVARAEWGWQPQYDLEEMVSDMLGRLEEKLMVHKE